MDDCNVIIREAKAEDCEQIIKLAKELAEYDKIPDAAKLDAETLRRDGFGTEKMFHCFVAEDGDRLVGHAVYFFRYCTWEGVNVHLEDLYVTAAYRHHGIGTRLLRKVAQVAVNRKCYRIEWTTLGWNKRAIDFYKSKGAVNITLEEEWNLFRICGEKLTAFANNA